MPGAKCRLSIWWNVLAGCLSEPMGCRCWPSGQAALSGCLACTSLENTAQQTDPFGGIVQDPWRVKTGSIT